MIKLDLHRAEDGTHFLIRITGEIGCNRIIIPLSPELTAKIDQICRTELAGTGLQRLPNALATPH